jgi:hypothetical protein
MKCTSGRYAKPSCQLAGWLQSEEEDYSVNKHDSGMGGDIMREDFAARVRANQQRLVSKLPARFDYIVCGAGASGCVVAGRLAADPKTQVLLLEAGGDDESEVITNPNRWRLTLGSELDWGFVAVLASVLYSKDGP